MEVAGGGEERHQGTQTRGPTEWMIRVEELSVHGAGRDEEVDQDLPATLDREPTDLGLLRPADDSEVDQETRDVELALLDPGLAPHPLLLSEDDESLERGSFVFREHLRELVRVLRSVRRELPVFRRELEEVRGVDRHPLGLEAEELPALVLVRVDHGDDLELVLLDDVLSAVLKKHVECLETVLTVQDIEDHRSPSVPWVADEELLVGDPLALEVDEHVLREGLAFEHCLHDLAGVREAEASLHPVLGRRVWRHLSVLRELGGRDRELEELDVAAPELPGREGEKAALGAHGDVLGRVVGWLNTRRLGRVDSRSWNDDSLGLALALLGRVDESDLVPVETDEPLIEKVP